MSTIAAPLPRPSSRTPRPCLETTAAGSAGLRAVVVGPLSNKTAASHAGTDTGVRHFIELRENAMLALKADALPELLCISGLLWITQEGDARDCMLHAGKTWIPKAYGKVVVTALRDSRVEIFNR